jgi:hypothetical protein
MFPNILCLYSLVEGLRSPLTLRTAEVALEVPRLRQIPESKNWADDTTVVTPVRMQGSCGYDAHFFFCFDLSRLNALFTIYFVSAGAAGRSRLLLWLNRQTRS